MSTDFLIGIIIGFVIGFIGLAYMTSSENSGKFSEYCEGCHFMKNKEKV